MLHEYYVIYSVRYYPLFHITAVGLGTYYQWIWGYYRINLHWHIAHLVGINKKGFGSWLGFHQVTELINKKPTKLDPLDESNLPIPEKQIRSI
jgi:hypothetical protein